MDISICIIAHNEGLCLERLLISVKNHAEEIVVVDDYSTDNTNEIALRYTDKVLQPPLPVKEVGLGISKTWMINQATKNWVLVVDADELVPEIQYIDPLLRYPGKNIWALPRRKWINYDKQIREEYDRYPDWQVRLFRNNMGYEYIGEMHERFSGSPVHYAYRGPHIEHLQTECRISTANYKNPLYKELSEKQGVTMVGGNVLVKE